MEKHKKGTMLKEKCKDTEALKKTKIDDRGIQNRRAESIYLFELRII